MKSLTEEIDRIVCSRYATQLSTLHSICTQYQHETAKWTARPCQIPVLVRRILSASPWPYIHELIVLLCSNIDVRDVFLQQQPTLLHDFITHDQQDAVIAILSHPLPPDVALPEQCQSFFLNVLDHAASSPTEQTVKTLHTMMNGALRPLMKLLTQETLERIERRLLSIVNGTQSADGNCFGLYALSTMVCMLDASTPNKAPIDADDLSTQWTPTKLRDYFDGRKAPKTLQLVVLKALWACRSETAEAREALQLSIELVKHISPSIREEWCRTNIAILRKLEEKIVQPGLADELRMSAMLFVSNLQSPFATPRAVQSVWSAQLSEPLKLAELLLPLSNGDLELYFTIVTSSALSGFVQSIPAIVLDEQLTSRSATALGRALDIVVSLIDTQRLMPDTIVSAHGSPAQYSQLLSLVKEPVRAQRQDGSCSVHFATQRNTMIARLCSLHLKAAVYHSRSAEHHTTLGIILDLHAAANRSITPCSHATPIPARPAYNLPPVPSNAHDWPDALDGYLQGRIAAERDGIQNLFHQRCQDLERRCEDVEQPLREERARFQSLQDRYDEVFTNYLSITEKAAQLEKLLQQETNSHTSVAAEVQTALAENDNLSSRLAETARYIEEIASQHAAKVEELESQHSSHVLKHSLEVATKQSQIDDLLEKLTHKQKEHDECQHLFAESQRASSKLMTTISDMKLDSQEQGLKADRIHQEYTLTLNNLTCERDASIAELQQQTAQHAETVSTMKSQAHDELAAALQALSAEHERVSTNQQRQHIEDLHSLQVQLIQAQDAHTRVEDEIVQAHATIRENTTKIEKLKSICIAKDEEIAKLSNVRDNMLAAMGIKPAQQYLELDDDSTILTEDLKASAQSMARSNKHSHRKSASVTTLGRQPTSVLRRVTSDVLPSTTSPRRRPLTGVSANASPGRRHTYKGHVSKISEEDLNETVFDGDDLLMSTPQI